MHPRFVGQLQSLMDAVEKEVSRRGEHSPSGANEKLLAALTRLVFDEVPKDPARKDFRQGDTLGAKRKHWFRAKFGNGRFRLFFRFRTDARIILYVWVNDADTLRTYGSRTDAYAVFEKMLESGDPPDDWDALLAAATSESTTRSAAALARKLLKSDQEPA
jgi:toxin YhaV